jgi:DNA-directed RNA polymerase specialized sigma subunit
MSASKVEDPILSELMVIKRLMLLALIKAGATQKDIAAALGVDQSQVSRMFPRAAKRKKDS